jgi:type IV secretory pathway VirB2 component (pilin)
MVCSSFTAAGSTRKGFDVLQTIITEMERGNFSFLILVIGIAQLIVMLRKKH